MFLFKTYQFAPHEKTSRRTYNNNKLKVIYPTWNDKF